MYTAKTNDLFDETMEAGLAADHPVTVAAKMLRLELLKTKAELELFKDRRSGRPG